MPDDDKYIKVHTDKRGKDHVDIYDNDPRDERLCKKDRISIWKGVIAVG